MKVFNFVRYHFVGFVLLIITSCGNGNNTSTGSDSSNTNIDTSRSRDAVNGTKSYKDSLKVDRATPYGKIKELNNRFETVVNGGGATTIDVRTIRKKQDEVSRIIDSSGEFVYAIITYKRNDLKNLKVTLANSFNGKSDSSIFIGKEFPFKLHDFPLAIKMEKSELRKLLDATKCKFFLFVPGIDTAWNPPNPKSLNSRHFTLSVLASSTTDASINRRHLPRRPGAKQEAMAADELPGRETWPEENFIWASGKMSFN